MAEQNIKTRIVMKHDIEANWDKASNFIPKSGELIIYNAEKDGDELPEGRVNLIKYPRFKVGDGVSKVSDLRFSKDAFSARYNSIEDALNDATVTPNGPVAAYEVGGNLHIMLLEDIESSAAINIEKNCTLHLNGKTLSLTASGAQLTVSAPNVTINGAVSGSAIKKENITGTSSVREYLVFAQGTSLVVNGGLYVLSGVANARTVTVFDLDAASAFDMNDCIVEGNNASHTFGIQCYGVVKIKKSVLSCKASNDKVAQAIISYAPGTEITETKIYAEATMPSQTHYAIVFSGDATVTGCTIYAELTSSAMIIGVRAKDCNVTISNSEVFAVSTAISAYVYGIRCEGNGNATIINCHIEADGYGDVDGTVFGTCAIHSASTSSVTINGGYYWGAREALSIFGAAQINGGVYEGCQHGGGYMSGANIKVKNAIFRNIEYTGDCGWSDSHFGAVYCGGDAGNANIYFDNCQFEAENYANNGIVAKYTGTNTYLSNCVFEGPFGLDLRVDSPNHMYVGKNVAYDTNKVSGTPDVTTYANQEFGFETELKDYESLSRITTSLLENKIKTSVTPIWEQISTLSTFYVTDDDAGHVMFCAYPLTSAGEENK